MIVRNVAACTVSALVLSLAACKETPPLSDPSTIDRQALESSVLANATSVTLAAADDLNRVLPPMSEAALRWGERDARLTPPAEASEAEPTSSTTTTGADLPAGPARPSPIVEEPRSATEAAEQGTAPTGTTSPATPKPMMPTAPAETASPSR